MPSPVFNCVTLGNQNNPPVMFLHGLMGDVSDWEEVTVPLSNDCYCVSLDLPWHGRTSCDQLDEYYDIGSVADDIVQYGKDRDIERPILVGYSMGGRIALHAVHKHPDYFTAVILESASPGLKTQKEQAERVDSDQLWAERMRVDSVAQLLADWYKQQVFSSLLENKQLYQQLIKRRSESFDGALYALALRAFSTGRQISLWSGLSTIKCPVQLIVGEKDSKFCEIAEQMAVELPNVELCKIKKAGHIVHLEAKDSFVEAIRKFLVNL